MKNAEQENTIQGKNYTSNGDFFKKKKTDQITWENVQNEVILS